MSKIKRLLIANRGEIAVRIARTCRATGVASVAVYSDADRRALHVLECDHAVHIGGSPAAESYLNIEAIIKAAKELEADALHPGYGLLSENPALAEACEAAGIIFVGPTPDVIRKMGDKAEARRIANEHNVPTVPGYDGEHQDFKKLAGHARKIGYPVMIKAAAGGGGRGMRLVESAREFREAAEGARREAERAFGNGNLILEKAIVGGRHIEVQVLADSHGNVVHLGERDCSVQRRHQKVIEETPSPFADDVLREEMGQAAVRLARAVGYTSAGTVEFMADEDGFYFLEMNTRLQVEHGLTELRTGLDLVELQLKIAAGERLPFSQQQVQFNGHAIECRVYAEDPQNNYLPSPGTITTLVLPEGESVRNDVGTYEGDQISTYYDPMISKLLTRGHSRAEALERMEDALADYQVEGVKTNLSLLRTVIAHPAFRTGSVTTEFLDSELPPEALADQATDAPLLSALGFLILGGDRSDAWRAAGPLRTAGRTHLDLEHAGRLHVLTGRRMAGTRDKWMVTVDGKKRPVQFALAPHGRVIVENNGQTHTARVAMRRGGIQVVMHDRAYDFVWSFGEQQRGAAEGFRPQGLTAPMNGLVLKVLVKPGDHVVAHQTVVVIEAMKMEHSIEAPHEGVVKEVLCKEGGRVTSGQVLLELEHEEKPT